MAGGGSSPGNESAADRQSPDRLLHNQRFVRFAFAKFLQLLAQYVLIYGLFIAVISRQESSLTTSAFVLASIVPSVIPSVPGGLVADLLPKKLILTLSMAARIVIVLFFLGSDLGLNLVLILTFLTWTANQFFTPAESAAVPAIAAPNQINTATSLLHAISLVAQLTGARRNAAGRGTAQPRWPVRHRSSADGQQCCPIHNHFESDPSPGQDRSGETYMVAVDASGAAGNSF